MNNPTGNLSAEKKLMLSIRLYYAAKELKRESLKKFHPELSENEIKEKLKKIFLYARS